MRTEPLLVTAVFVSAALVFQMQPLIGRLLLPSLGGATAVWSVSLVFFQAALLAGYAYAHLLQRLRPAVAQGAAHLVVLATAALVLPLGIKPLGEPDVARPTLWLLATLTLSAGAPFAVLSATAPLLQSWWAAVGGGRRDPYPLYAASNLGSFGALLLYPLVVEPLLGLQAQRWAWTAGYAGFAALAAVTVLGMRRSSTAATTPTSIPSRPSARRWVDRGWWALLGALPSSLLVGVTAHIATDVASAPLLWVAPLALYLLTFVVAFSGRADGWRGPVLLGQAVAVPAVLATSGFNGPWLLMLPLHLLAFTLAALACHQRLAADRPGPERLTEFYLALAAGGAIGGAATALAAPAVLERVWEYPAALVLTALVRPWRWGRPTPQELAVLALGLVAAGLLLTAPPGPLDLAKRSAFAALIAAAILIRDRVWLLGPLLALIAVCSAAVGAAGRNDVRAERGFFGVNRVSLNSVPELGAVRFLTHGMTLHGAQSAEPDQACRPLTYYARATPLGQAAALVQARGPAEIGVVGLGTGAMAGHARPGDRFRFYEIDPVVAGLARREFTYLDACAPGRTEVVLGDARLTVGRERAGRFDLLLVDAFSSDAVPTHLLTTEAMAVWLKALKPDGVLVLHLSNRNLELEGPAAAALRAQGLAPLSRWRGPSPGAPPMAEAGVRAVAATCDPERLAALRAGGWRDARRDVAPWTDDHADLVGAMLRR